MKTTYQSTKAQTSEQRGRDKYLEWISTKPECQHLYFSQHPYREWDAVFMSGGTLCITDIKYRNYDKHFFYDYPPKVDRSKAAFLYRLAGDMEAKPLIMTITSDDYYFISDVSRATKDDVTTEQWQANDDTGFIITKKVLNLRRCQIS